MRIQSGKSIGKATGKGASGQKKFHEPRFSKAASLLTAIWLLRAFPAKAIMLIIYAFLRGGGAPAMPRLVGCSCNSHFGSGSGVASFIYNKAVISR